MTTNNVSNSENSNNYSKRLLHDAAILMEDNVNQCELTLQRISKVRISRSFWDGRWVKDDLIILMNKMQPFDKGIREKAMFSLIKRVMDRCRALRHPLPFDNRELPKSIGDEILEMIEEMGFRLAEYLKDLYRSLSKFNKEYRELAIEAYINNLKWTDIGTIDYGGTAKNAIGNMEFRDESLEYLELCLCCLEDDIENWFIKQRKNKRENSMLNWTPPVCSTANKFDDIDYYLMAYWHSRFEQKEQINTPSDLIKHYEYFHCFKLHIYDAVSIDVNSLILCMAKKIFTGVEYFWSRIGENSRNRYFLFVSAWCIRNLSEIQFFHLRKMNLKRCCYLLHSLRTNDLFPVIPLIIHGWRDFSFPTLEMFTEYLCIVKEERYFSFIHYVCLESADHRLTYKPKKLRNLLYEIFRLSVNTFRINWIKLESNITKSLTIGGFLNTEDMDFLNTVVNHEVLIDIRPEILNFMAESFKTLLGKLFTPMANDVKMFRQFRENVLLNDNERSEFLNKIIGRDVAPVRQQ